MGLGLLFVGTRIGNRPLSFALQRSWEFLAANATKKTGKSKGLAQISAETRTQLYAACGSFSQLRESFVKPTTD